MRGYGIPGKMVQIIADLYEVFECAVIEDNEICGPFKIEAEVKQGCVM